MAELTSLGAVIKATYESEPDTNAFTDAEKAKLAAIDPENIGAVYDSVAAVEGLNIPSGITAIRTNGYYSPGDGGGALYKRVDSEPSHAGKIQSADGAWWELSPNQAVTVKMFGARGDGVTDDAPATRAAFSFVGQYGGELRFPAGDYLFDSIETPPSNIAIVGDGIGATRLRTTGASGDRIFSSVGTPRENLTISGIEFIGTWLSNQSESGSNGLVTFTQFDTIKILNCAFKYSRFFSININLCRNVIVSGCVFKHGVRDFCGVWGTPNVIVTNNIFIGNNDDAVSIAARTNTGLVRDNIIVANNTFEDTLGMRLSGAKNALIAGNVMRRMKGHGILLATPSSDKTATVNVLITGNVITDVIDRSYAASQIDPSINLRTYIRIEGDEPQAGSLSVPPGELNVATGQVEAPYDYFYNLATESDPLRVSTGIVISNNILRRTLPAVASYEDWGYGKCFTTNGFINDPVDESLLRGRGIDIDSPAIDSLIISENYVNVGTHGVFFRGFPSKIRKVRIKGNHFEDFKRGIGSSASSLIHVDMLIDGNFFDGDPNFLDDTRDEGGRWSNYTGVIAMDLRNLGGVSITNNHVRNCGSAILQGSESQYHLMTGNVVYADPAAPAANLMNRGIGNIPRIGDGSEWWLQSVDSDPNSPTYGVWLGANRRMTLDQPTEGKWLAGTRVRSRSTDIIQENGNEYIRLGFLRLTNGDQHEPGVDWKEIKALIS